MPGSDGIITTPQGRFFHCSSCENAKAAVFKHRIPDGADQDQFAADHIKANHKYRVHAS